MIQFFLHCAGQPEVVQEVLADLKRHDRGHWSGVSKETTLIVILYHSFSLAALVFNWSSAMTCSTFGRVKKVNSSARVPPWRNWQKQILRNISSVPIIRALFGPCAWRWLRRGTTFEWSQQIRKQIMRSLNFWKTNYSTIYAPVHHIQLLPQWDLESIDLIFNDKITNLSQTSLVHFSSVNTSIPNNEEGGLSSDQPPLTSPQNQRASSWQWSAGSWDVSLWDLGSRCSRESWKIRNIF